MDPILLTQKLIQCPSITPSDAGCLDIIESYLKDHNFICWRLPFGNVDNLYARYGVGQPNFCFAGHTDVVSVIDEDAWSVPPFAAHIEGDRLIGRGVVDMKGAIGAFLSAVTSFLDKFPSFDPTQGSISFLLTSDEEGVAIHGTREVIKWLQNKGEKIDFCLVGEPTNPNYVGDMIKIGRRGSINATITAAGKAGHIAYPENALNPISILLDYLQDVRTHTFDHGNEHFAPTHLEISTIDVGNDTKNIIPSTASACLNIRFNSQQTGEKIQHFLEEQATKFSPHVHVKTTLSGEAFIGGEDSLNSRILQVVKRMTGKTPVLSTSGGTSDARFIKDLCPVVEFGLVSQTAHQINESIAISEIHLLKEIYEAILVDFFNLGLKQQDINP